MHTSSTPRRLSDQAWVEDLRFMVSSLTSVHPDLYHAVSPVTFQQEVAALTGAIPHSTDDEILVGMLKIIAMTQDWHTQIISGNLTERWFPIRIERLQDGLFITSASRANARLLGSKVLRIGDCTAEEAFERVCSITAYDNLSSQKYFASMWLSIPTALNGLHIISDEKTLQLEIQAPGRQTQEVNLLAETFDADDDLTWFWLREAAPTADWVSVAAGKEMLPLFWKNTEKFYWLEYLEAYRLVYVGFNLTANDEAESFTDFNLRLWALVDRQQVERLVIDLRHNLGGDRDILPPLIDGIIQRDRINRGENLYVIIGPKNVSASAHCAVWLEQQAHPTFVGEPTGARPNQYADPEHVRLPNSQYRMMVSKKYWQNTSAQDTRTYIEPHIQARFKAEDYFNLHDPAMEVILDLSLGKP